MQHKKRTGRHLPNPQRFAAALGLILLLLAAAGARAQTQTTFRLEGYDIFKPGSPVTVSVNAYNIDSLDMRVYRIKDPVAFFKRQKDMDYPNPYATLGKAQKQSLLDEFNNTAKKRYRGLLQQVTNSDAREKAVENFDIELDGPKPKAPRSVPLLKEKNGFEMIARFDYKIKNPSPDSWKYERADLPIKEAGTYLVEAVGNGRAAYVVVPVTTMRVIDKSSSEDKLVFVCDGISGKPLPGAEVTFMERSGGKGYAHFQTVKAGKDGIASLHHDREADITYLVSKGKDFLATSFYYYEWRENDFKVYIYTDRPIYRPGHTVHFKAIMREDKGGELVPVAGREVSVMILNSSYDKVEEMTLKTNDLGTLEGTFTLKDYADLGRYQIQVGFDDLQAFGQFKVEEYRKPEYKVKVTPGQASYVAGDTVTATIQADYFFGEPVANAAVEYQIYQSRYYIPWWSDYGEDYQYGWYYATDEEYDIWDSKLIEKGEAELDASGRAQITIPPRALEHDAVYRIVAKVTDKNRQEVDGQGMAKVSRGLFVLRATTNRYSYSKGDTVKAGITSKTIDGKPVSEAVRVAVSRHEWIKNSKGTWEEKTSLVSERTVRTDSKGAADYEFKVKESGSYTIALKAEDARGNTVEADAWVYAYTDDGNWYIPNQDGSIEIIADKKGYQAGDTARLIFMSSIENATMLITVEGDHVYEHKVVQLDGANTSYEVKLKSAYAPNLFVNATIVSNLDFFTSEKELVFPPLDKFLNIELSTDKAEYQPGEQARVTVRVTNRDGKPVDAEVSVGIVDEAIYSISEEIAPDIKKFFYSKRWNRVQTDYAWGFYSYGYSKEMRMLLARGRSRALGRADLKPAKDKVRSNFKDTMHWEPTVRTGKDGVATITAKCPDNLTSWRITARAADAQTRVGQATKLFLERKRLILRLSLPRFFRQGDTVVLSTTVHNYLDGERKVKVSLKAQGLSVDPSGARTVTIPKGGSMRLDWTATVPAGAGQVTVSASADAGDESDAIELTVPRLPFGMEVSRSDYIEVGSKKSSGSLSAAFPKTTDLANASLRVEVSPTLAGGVFSSLDYLIGYPYGCVEQTMSSFLPDIIVAQAIKGTDQAKNKRFKKLPDMVGKGLDRLTNYQHSDGGWGWWEDDETHPFMTAYVVFGLTLARDADFPVSETMLQRGISSLQDQIKDEKLDLTTRLYMAYALAVAGDTNPEPAASIYHGLTNGKTELNNYSRSLLALTLHRLGRENSAREVANDIIRNAVTKNGRTHWAGKNWHYNWQDDVNETTAQCIRALAAIKPEAPEIVQAVRWLVGNRAGGNHWNSTRDTAMIVFALLDFSRASGELAPNATAAITVNGAEKKRTFSKKDAFADPWVFTVKGADLRIENAVKVTRSGKTPLYVTVTRTYYRGETPIPAADAGFTVQRTYNLLKPERAGSEWIYIKKPVIGPVNPGDEILVTVKIAGNKNAEYVMIQDFLPSGCEVVRDTRGYSILGDPFRGFRYGESYYGRHVEIRDNRVGFFRTYFWEGTDTLQYIMRPELPGTFSAMPAVAELMYYPDVKGNSSDFTLQVVEKDEGDGGE